MFGVCVAALCSRSVLPLVKLSLAEHQGAALMLMKILPLAICYLPVGVDSTVSRQGIAGCAEQNTRERERRNENAHRS